MCTSTAEKPLTLRDSKITFLPVGQVRYLLLHPHPTSQCSAFSQLGDPVQDPRPQNLDIPNGTSEKKISFVYPNTIPSQLLGTWDGLEINGNLNLICYCSIVLHC